MHVIGDEVFAFHLEPRQHRHVPSSVTENDPGYEIGQDAGDEEKQGSDQKQGDVFAEQYFPTADRSGEQEFDCPLTVFGGHDVRGDDHHQQGKEKGDGLLDKFPDKGGGSGRRRIDVVIQIVLLHLNPQPHEFFPFFRNPVGGQAILRVDDLLLQKGPPVGGAHLFHGGFVGSVLAVGKHGNQDEQDEKDHEHAPFANHFEKLVVDQAGEVTQWD